MPEAKDLPPVDSSANKKDSIDTVSGLAEQLYLTYCIPAQTSFSFETAFSSLSRDEKLPESFPVRECLYFGGY